MINSLSTSQKLKIWDFADPVAFLRAYYEQRKSQSSGFSYGQWAVELGLKSRSFLRLVLVGQRSLTADVAELIVKSLKFNQNEAKYFIELLALSKAGTLKEKEQHSRELAKLHQKFAMKDQSLLEISKKDLFDFLSSYKIPRLQVLLTLNDIEKTSENLAKLLGDKPAVVQDHLEVLRKLGLAEQRPDLSWVAKKAQIGTSDLLGNIALQSFHRKSLEEAIEAINLPQESRRFQSLVLPMTEEEFKTLHQELRTHLEHCLAKLESSEGHNKRVYQINLNMIPVTSPILRDEIHAPVDGSETKGTSV